MTIDATAAALDARAEHAGLLDLAIAPLVVDALALDLVSLPQHPSSTLRGAFGSALKDLVCVHRERPECVGCPHGPSCSFPPLFSPHADPGQPGTRGFEELPRPFVLRLAPEGHSDSISIPAGSHFTWQCVLVGSAIQRLPLVVLAFRQMGEAGLGRGRGRFQVRGVRTALDPVGPAVFSAADGTLHPEAVKLYDPQQASCQRLTLRFVTPTQIRQGGRDVAVPEFRAIWHAVQLRLSTLRLAHGAGRPAVDFRGLLDQAERVRLTGWKTQGRHWERFSQRQGRRIPMAGFCGVAHYEGDLGPFLPALRLAEWTGIGNNATFGQGWFCVEQAD